MYLHFIHSDGQAITEDHCQSLPISVYFIHSDGQALTVIFCYIAFIFSFFQVSRQLANFVIMKFLYTYLNLLGSRPFCLINVLTLGRKRFFSDSLEKDLM